MFEGTKLKPGWWSLHRLQVIGCVLTTVSIVLMVVLAWVGAKEQPTVSQMALIALIGASFQLVAAWVFSRVNRVDLTHAGASVRRLYGLALRAEEATDNAERARAKNVSSADVRGVINQLSVELSVLQEGLVDAAQDWTDALPELLSQPKKTPPQKDAN